MWFGRGLEDRFERLRLELEGLVVVDEALLVEEGALYPALYRMQAKAWIEAEWGLSENNRRAKYYQLTVEGRRHLRSEVKTWKAYANAVAKVLQATQLPAPEGS